MMNQDYSYNFESDLYYCYPNTTVLRNKLNITDAVELKVAEREITALRMTQASENPIKGLMDFSHLKSIHKFIFSDVYEWAGKIRTVNISKGNQFCLFEHIEIQSQQIFDKLKSENYLAGLNEKRIAIKKLAYYISEINAIHPFREGNGRTQRLYIEYLALLGGYSLDFSKISEEEMIEASAHSFTCDYTMMEGIFSKIISPLSHEEQQLYTQAILRN